MMDSYVIGLIGIAILFLLLAMGVHIAVALTVSGLTGLLLILGSFEPVMKVVVLDFYHRVTLTSLITVPLFVLMGYLASGGGISRNIYESLNLWIGRFKSGIGVATVFACTAFGTVCGSSFVTAAVFSKISAPEMRRCGYDPKLAYGICASAGSIGMLIPPSILAIVYGILSGESIHKLLMAGVAPGVILAAIFSATIILIGYLKPSMLGSTGTARSSVPFIEKVHSLKNWWTVVIVAFVVFGGLYGGIFSPSESAAVSAFTLLAVYLCISVASKDRRKSMSKELLSIFSETAVTSAMIFFVLGGATVFSQFITMSGLTEKLSRFILDSHMSNLSIVMMVVVLLLILGCFLDSTSICCITIPIFNPIIKAAGIDTIWYATVVIVAIEVGLITPPFGLNVFATKGVAEADVKLEDIFRGSFPFFIGMLVLLAFLIAVPPVSTFLPNFVK
jgi:tripartite ATP-independent transporter DctM subunit